VTRPTGTCPEFRNVSKPHEELCYRALCWLKGTRRCNPVFSGIASCSEIPDAIGWSSNGSWYGSTVLECKTSVQDFWADQKKHFQWKHKEKGWRMPAQRFTKKEAREFGYKEVPLTVMGDFRFYFCQDGVLPKELIAKHRPDHGLLYLVRGKKGHGVVKIIIPAPQRNKVNKEGEIRYLRFAIINSKYPHLEAEKKVGLRRLTPQSIVRMFPDTTSNSVSQV
jgi:hypothetical protein